MDSARTRYSPSLPTRTGTAREPSNPPTAMVEMTSPMAWGLKPRTLTKYRVSKAEPKANPMLVMADDATRAANHTVPECEAQALAE